MAENFEYVREDYSEGFGCYFVREYTNGTPTYLYRGYVRGNKVTLYPHRALYTTNIKRGKKDISIFDLKSGR